MPLTYCEKSLREQDTLRYLAVLFAPSMYRQELSTLYYFDYEIARINLTTSEPTSGLIRLQWWRETIEALFKGTTRNHPVIQELAPLLEKTPLKEEQFIALIDARDKTIDFHALQTTKELENYAMQSHFILNQLSQTLLKQDGFSEQENEQLAIAQGLIEVIRNTITNLNKQKLFFPEELANKYGATIESLIQTPDVETTSKITEELTILAEQHLKNIKTIPRKSPLLAHKIITQSYVKQLKKIHYNIAQYNIEACRHLLPLKLVVQRFLRNSRQSFSFRPYFQVI
jgi:phytoene/squalene synthetase